MAAVGTVTITYSEGNNTPIRTVTWTWTCDASGNASGTDTKSITGTALRFVTKPTDGPTDNYDIVVNDAQGVDIARGALANRDTTNAEEALPAAEVTINAHTYATFGTQFDGPLSMSVSNAGNAKSGVLIMYYRAG